MRLQSIFSWLFVFCIGTVALLSCSEEDGSGDSGGDAGGDADADSDADGDADTDTDADTDSSDEGVCVGIPDSCKRMTLTCADQQGCYESEICSGLVTSCMTFDGNQSGCVNQIGCTWREDCTGISTSCSSMFSSVSCTSQDGCTWNASTNYCSGISTSCYSIYTSYGCIDQDGCSWEEDCSGIPTLCGDLTTTQCPLQDGCSLADGCMGSADKCSGFSTKATCTGQAGCTWSEDGTLSGVAFGKFCNRILIGDEEVVLKVVVSSLTKEVTLTAKTGQCSTPVGQPCELLPIGSQIGVTFALESGEIINQYVFEQLQEDDQVYFYATAVNGQAVLEGGVLVEGLTCAEMDIDSKSALFESVF